MMSTMKSGSGERLELCRFEAGCSPIVLSRIAVKSNVLIQSLEDSLDDSLDPAFEFPVEYPQQEDALLLHCRIPRPIKAHPPEENILASITGLPEEYAGSHSEVNMQIYQGISMDGAATTKCQCQPPMSSWERRHQENGNEPASEVVDMMFVDLRPCSSTEHNMIPSLTSASHFFRSLFKATHAASPWCPTNEKIFETTLPDRVALLFAGQAPDTLFDVRVGDIAPSWSLHSISRLQVPQRWSPWDESTGTPMTLPAPTTLLVFRQLPPRPLLFTSPPPSVPLDGSPLSKLPEGCMWEVYFECVDNDYNEDEKKQPSDSTPVKIPHCRMASPPYLCWKQDYEQKLLQPLLDNWKEIRNEALSIPQWTAWPETQHYSKASSRRGNDETNDGDTCDEDPESFHPTWTVFPLCHCFPANQPENKKWIAQTCGFVPRTMQLLKSLGPLLRTALFSRLDPETTLQAHTGWSDLANYVYRFHLPLIVPPGEVCGTWVDGCVATHQEGQFLCFDDSKTHRAFNYSSGERIVLILDLARPNHLPIGTATGGHSDELDQFIAKMNL